MIKRTYKFCTPTLLAGLLTVALMACGSDKDAALTKAEWIKKAKSVCLKSLKESEKVSAPLGNQKEATVAYFEKIGELTSAELAGYRAIGEISNAADNRQKEEILKAYDKAVKTLKEAASLYQKGSPDQELIQAKGAELAQISNEMTTKATAFGLSCNE